MTLGKFPIEESSFTALVVGASHTGSYPLGAPEICFLYRGLLYKLYLYPDEVSPLP
jgi:hypothetical protein